MKISKKARITGLREAVAATLHGPVYSAYCICWFVTIAVSLVSALMLTPNQNPLSIIIVSAISLIVLIIPCALLVLRKNQNSAIVRRFASYIKVIYIAEWIGLVFLALLLLLFAIIFLIGGDVRAKLLEVTNREGGTIISLIVSLAVIPPNLFFYKRFVRMLKETSAILEGKAADTSCFHPAAKAALMAACAQIAWACMYIMTRGQWTAVTSVILAFLLWFVLREAAEKVNFEQTA